MSIPHWNAILNIITNIDYLAIPVAFVVLRNLREPDVPQRVLLSRVLFVLACGAHHGAMAAVLLLEQPLWAIRTPINVVMAGVSCWSVVEHVIWARTKPAPVSVREFQEVKGQAAALARSNAELERFAYVASHDLQEPLRTIASYSQLLERRYGDRLDEEASDYLSYMVDGAKRMQSLILALLTLSRVDSEDAERTHFSANEAADEAVANVRGRIDEAGARVLRSDLPDIVADRVQIAQIFQNLVENALKYRRNGSPRVEIGGEEGELEWKFSVRDDGIGIEPEYHERIFEVFQRLHGHGEFEGTGLGLALCRRIIERHGGRIWVESDPGRGSTFYFTVPRPPAAQAW